jgi:hypothetical protein
MQSKPNRKLLPNQLPVAENEYRNLVARPEAGTTLLEMQNPAYWAHVAKMLRGGDHIEVWPADRSWWAELLVLVVEPFAVVVHVLREASFHSAGVALADIEAPEGYEFKHRGAKGWAVMRLDDKTELQGGHSSKEAAAAWLSAHLRKIGVAQAA